MKRELASLTLAAAAVLGGALAGSASTDDDGADVSAAHGVKDPDAHRELTTDRTPQGDPTLQDFVFEDGVSRSWGANRYATAAAISQNFGWDNTNTISVYIASGESTADALTMGPSTLADGPMLLVKRDTIPSQTRAELARLQPCFIHLTGGDTVINDAVFRQLKSYANPMLCQE